MNPRAPISTLSLVILFLVILSGWQSWNYGRLKIEVAFAEEQTHIFEAMRRQALKGNPLDAAKSLEYVVDYYPSGTKQRAGSPLDKVVERMRFRVIADIILHLRQKTGEDLGEKPETWIEKYAHST